MEKLKVGFIGTGMMGNPMATRLLDAGYPLYLYNRSVEKTESLAKDGAIVCTSPFDVAAQSDCVFTMLTGSEALETVALGKNGILQGLHEGAIHIDCSTILASTSIKLYDKYKSLNKHFIHSPVLGSVTQATDGILLMFPGGDNKPLENVMPLINILAKSVWKFDHPSQSTNLKIALNSIIAGTIAMLSQSMVFVEKAGIDNSIFLEVLSNSALNSTTIQFKGGNILDRNFVPRFTVENLLKDNNYMVESCKTEGCRADIAESISGLLKDAITLGHGQEDYSAIIKAFEAAANTEVKRKG